MCTRIFRVECGWVEWGLTYPSKLDHPLTSSCMVGSCCCALQVEIPLEQLHAALKLDSRLAVTVVVEVFGDHSSAFKVLHIQGCCRHVLRIIKRCPCHAVISTDFV